MGTSASYPLDSKDYFQGPYAWKELREDLRATRERVEKAESEAKAARELAEEEADKRRGVEERCDAIVEEMQKLRENHPTLFAKLDEMRTTNISQDGP